MTDIDLDRIRSLAPHAGGPGEAARDAAAARLDAAIRAEHTQPRCTRRRRRWMAAAVAAGVLVTTAGTVTAIREIPGGGRHEPPAQPDASLARADDAAAAASGDAAAAERVLRSAGWRPFPGSLEPLVGARPGGEPHTLWAYRGRNGRAVMLAGGLGVHSECHHPGLRVCGAAMRSAPGAESLLNVVGTTVPRATRTVIMMSDGGELEAPTGGGYWFARITFGATSPRPAAIRSYDAAGRTVATGDRGVVASLRGYTERERSVPPALTTP